MPPTTDDLLLELELQRRAFEAISSLVRALGTSLDVADIARASLLTVSGQLLVRKAGFYVLEDDALRLCAVVGTRDERLGAEGFPFDPSLAAHLGSRGGSAPIDPAWAVPDVLREHFDTAALLRDHEQPVGLLVFGGRVPGRSFDDVESQLLETMGVAIGATIQRALSFERMRRAKLEMEETEKTRAMVLDHVSHELRTPVMVAKSAMEFARDASPDERDEFFTMHEEAIARLTGLIDAVVRIASNDDEVSTELEWTDLATVRREVVDPALASAPAHDGFLRHVTCSHDADVAAPLDRSAVREALEALLRNAETFARPEHRWCAVHVYAAPSTWWERQDHAARPALYATHLAENDSIRAPLFPGGEGPPPACDGDASLVLEIVDAGIGIPEDDLGMIFEPFGQASNSPSRGVRGGGMGLARARRALESCGGTLSVRSAEGEGSVFALAIPGRGPARG